MSSESVCQVARSWVDVGSFHTCLFGVVYFAVTLVREFLDTPLYMVVVVVHMVLDVSFCITVSIHDQVIKFYILSYSVNPPLKLKVGKE
jgi:hypothetical protein